MPLFRSGKPWFRVVNSVSQALVAGANAMAFDTVIGEDPVAFAGGAGYTVDRPGLYLVHVSFLRAATATSSPATARARINGVSTQIEQSIPTNAVIPVSVTTLVMLAAGDVISGNATGHTTAASSIVAGTAIMWGVRVGPVRWT